MLCLRQILVADGVRGIVEVLGIAFEESHRGEFGRLDVQIFGLRKLEQRTQIAGAGGVNDDDALALFELGDNVVAVNRRKQQHGDGEEKGSGAKQLVQFIFPTVVKPFVQNLKSKLVLVETLAKFLP